MVRPAGIELATCGFEVIPTEDTETRDMLINAEDSEGKYGRTQRTFRKSATSAQPLRLLLWGLQSRTRKCHLHDYGVEGSASTANFPYVASIEFMVLAATLGPLRLDRPVQGMWNPPVVT